MIRLAYQLVNRFSYDQMGYMNYGYAAIGGPEDQPRGPSEASAERYSMQLYDAVASAVDLAGKDVLEVGCGRGGGSAFLSRDRKARSVTGVDFATSATVAWNFRGRGPTLRFVLGDAEQLPFRSSSFDVVVNVESSHCYPDLGRFLGEVGRVLRPGGELRFYEHVLAHRPGFARMQRAVDVVYPRINGWGCHAARDTPAEIEAAGFEIERIRRFPFRASVLDVPLSPHVLGVARRPGHDGGSSDG